jgi:hypothetical protein
MGERVSALLKRSVEHLEDEVPASYRIILNVLDARVGLGEAVQAGMRWLR